MHFLITGATGYIGKHILCRLLELGHRVTAVARPRNGRLRERLAQVLAPFGLPPGLLTPPALETEAGDITQYRCALDAASIARLRGCEIRAFIHCAGLTRFDAHLSDEISLNNRQGTENAYRLCEDLGIDRFHHLSTAFVAGDHTQSFGPGDLDVGQGFNNPYEASKFAAERFLDRAGHTSRIRTTVYRPSIVVGGQAIGENNVVNTVYTFLKAIHFLRECWRRDVERGRDTFTRHGVEPRGDDLHIPMRVAADPDTLINLVSIDTVVDTVIHRILSTWDRGGVVQLTAQDFRLQALRDAFCKVMHVTGSRFVGPADFEREPRNVVEEHFHRVTRVYAPYLLRSPVFANTRLGFPHSVDPEAIARDFLDQSNLENRGRKRDSINKLALDTLGVSDPADYFERLVNRDLGGGFLQRIAYVDARIRFRIHGERPFDQVIHFDHGRARYANGQQSSKADCCYELHQDLFIQVIKGEVDLRKAFFQGRLKISGNRETGLKFGTLIDAYYQRIDEHIIDEVAV